MSIVEYFGLSSKIDRKSMGFFKERISRRNFLQVLGAGGISLAAALSGQSKESEAYLDGLEPERWQPNFDQIVPPEPTKSPLFTPGPDGKYHLGVPGVVKDGGELPLPKTWKRPEWPREILVQPARKGPTDKPKVAITIDDGWGFAPEIADILDQPQNRDVTVTTFLIGSWMQSNPDLVKRFVDSGQEIANHGAHHWTLSSLGDEGLKAEILGCEEILKSIIGQSVTTKPFLRPSGGVYDQRVANIAADLGFRLFLWSIDLRDWQAGTDPNWLSSSIVSTATAGDIILLHFGRHSTIEAFQAILDGLRNKGLKPVGLSELMS